MTEHEFFAQLGELLGKAVYLHIAFNRRLANEALPVETQLCEELHRLHMLYHRAAVERFGDEVAFRWFHGEDSSYVPETEHAE